MSQRAHNMLDFRKSPYGLQLRVVEFLSVAPLLRYSTCKYTTTLKPRLGVTRGHQIWYHSIRHQRFPINVP